MDWSGWGFDKNKKIFKNFALPKGEKELPWDSKWKIGSGKKWEPVRFFFEKFELGFTWIIIIKSIKSG